MYSPSCPEYDVTWAGHGHPCFYLTARVAAARHREGLRARVDRVVASRVLDPTEVALHADTPGGIVED